MPKTLNKIQELTISVSNMKQKSNKHATRAYKNYYPNYLPILSAALPVVLRPPCFKAMEQGQLLEHEEVLRDKYKLRSGKGAPLAFWATRMFLVSKGAVAMGQAKLETLGDQVKRGPLAYLPSLTPTLKRSVLEVLQSYAAPGCGQFYQALLLLPAHAFPSVAPMPTLEADGLQVSAHPHEPQGIIPLVLATFDTSRMRSDLRS